ncbi:MAG: hypothetical protein ACWGN2_08960 [Anaerolineales bacterium]
MTEALMVGFTAVGVFVLIVFGLAKLQGELKARNIIKIDEFDGTLIRLLLVIIAALLVGAWINSILIG